MNKKLLGMVIALNLGLTATAFAATGADSFSDVPKDHWSYEALDILAKDGIIEGYNDGTFQGNRTMTRYEMASIVAKAMTNGGGSSLTSQAVLEKLEKEYDGELAALQDRMTKAEAQIAENKKAIEKVNFHGFIRTQWDNDDLNGGNKDADRFYLNLYGDFKVSDMWTAKFQSETNRHYSKDNAYGERADKTWSGHDGNIQRIWVEGDLGDGKWVNVGRSWRGLGFQNQLQGNETDGVQFGIPVGKSGFTASAFVMSPTSVQSDSDSAAGKFDTTDYTLYGLAGWGPVGHNFDLNVAYAKSTEDINYKIDGKYDNSDGTHNRYYGKSGGFGDYGAVVSFGTNLNKNLRLIGDYIWTGADEDNKTKAVRLNYKDTNENDVGSFGLYARYLDKQRNGNISGDDEWGSLQDDSKMYIFGVKYVPWQNVVWETLYENAKIHPDTADEYTRNLVRTQFDFHF
jgi:hypothetical protein